MEKILERVAKLLNLAGNNPNEAEAAAAIEKAHALLAAHNLTLAAVQAHGQKIEQGDREAAKTGTKFSEKYYAWIWMACADLNYCKMFCHRPNPKLRDTYYTVVGRQVNVIVATQMAMYLCQTIRRLANEEAVSAGRKDHAFKNAFLAGCASRLYHRIEAMRKFEVASTGADTSNALAIWSGSEEQANAEFIEKTLGIKLRTGVARRTKSMDWEGYTAGSAAGDKVNLNQQVQGNANETKRIGG
jgi:hypothetical protein